MRKKLGLVGVLLATPQTKSFCMRYLRGEADTIYRVRGVWWGNTLVSQKPPSYPDMLTNFASRVI
jgi:hypothetical protein